MECKKIEGMQAIAVKSTARSTVLSAFGRVVYMLRCDADLTRTESRKRIADSSVLKYAMM